jgi:hypothetical protein
MNPRFQGFGRFVGVIPALSYIPLRVFLDDWEESHRLAAASLCLLVSALITFAIAAIEDKKVGIDVFTRPAWSANLMESHHIFYYLPIRIVAVLMFIASATISFF